MFKKPIHIKAGTTYTTDSHGNIIEANHPKPRVKPAETSKPVAPKTAKSTKRGPAADPAPRDMTAPRDGWAAPDLNAIVPRLLTIRGDKVTFRATKPDTTGLTNIDAARCYFLWRMARFHAAIDQTLPMVAMLRIHGDPFSADLDADALALALQAFAAPRGSRGKRRPTRPTDPTGHELDAGDDLPSADRDAADYAAGKGRATDGR